MKFHFDTRPISERLPVTPVPAELQARMERVERSLNEAAKSR
jgi:hypothetical protein